MQSIAQIGLNTIKDTIASGISGFSVGWISLKAISWVLFVVNYFIGLIGSTLFILSSGLVELGLKLNTTILDSSVVQLGWRIVRDFANLGFTIGIVIIAYATILGYESYGIKKTLRSLIVAAFLVNFSFSIAGFFIDGSNMVTHFFVTKATGGGMTTDDANIHALALNLAYAFSPQKLFDISDPRNDAMNVDTFTALTEAMGGAFKLVISMFFITLFTLFASLGMLAAALTILYRYIWLSGLIIAMPGAILCYVFDYTKKWGKMWWEKFTCHLLYLPALTFSIYLILMYVGAKGVAIQASAMGGAASAGGAFNSMLDIMSKPFQTISDMVIMLAMLFFGITASQKMSCAIGNVAIDGVKNIKDWAIGTVKGAPGWTTRKILNAGPEPDKNLGNRLGNVIAKIPIVNRLVNPLRGFMAPANKNVKENAEKYKNLTKDQLLSMARNPLITTQFSGEELAGMGKAIAEKGLINTDPAKGIPLSQFKKFIPSMKQFGLEKDALKIAPHLFQEFGWDINQFDKFMTKDFKPDDMDTVSEEALGDQRFVSRLTAGHLKKLDAPSKKEHREQFSATLTRMAENNHPEFKTFMQKSFAADAMDIITPDALRNQAIVSNLTNTHLKKLDASDKAEHRTATRETLNAMDSASLKVFMNDNFKKNKDVDDIHEDFFKDQGFVTNLNSSHIERLRDNTDTKQQMTFVDTLEKAYTQNIPGFAFSNEYAEYLKNLDTLAEPLVDTDRKTRLKWSGIFENPETQAKYDRIKKEYEKRHPPEQKNPPTPPQLSTPPPPPIQGPTNPPTPPQPPPSPPPAPPPASPSPQPTLPPPPPHPTPPPTNPPQPTPPLPTPNIEKTRQLERLSRTIWDINAVRKNSEEVIAAGENPSVVSSVQDTLKRLEKKYEKITGQKPPHGAVPYPPDATPPEPPIIPGKPNPLSSNPPTPPPTI